MKKEFTIQSYNPIWKETYQREKEKLTHLFGDFLISIHHIGSTAIPYTSAKPEIDILVVVKDDSQLPYYDPFIESLGYKVRGECLDSGGTPGRFYYSKDTGNIRTHKMHICQKGHSEIMAKLLFVKYLNEDADAAIAYAKLKTTLSQTYNYGKGIGKYLEGKTAFILDILEKAEKKYSHLSFEDFIE